MSLDFARGQTSDTDGNFRAATRLVPVTVGDAARDSVQRENGLVIAKNCLMRTTTSSSAVLQVEMTTGRRHVSPYN
ncbi:MAG: hypothetical protein JWL79_155 [Frankiales bacterium]|nr:hypothetical protein [Frankiales bacterium]